MRNYFIFKQDVKKVKNECSICDTKDCSRHLKVLNFDQWQELAVTNELDEAVDSVILI